MILTLDIWELLQIVIFVIILLLLGILCLFINIKLSNKRMERKSEKMEENREIANKIIDKFEELLAKHEVKIPNEERQGDENEACIYGRDYYDLEDDIAEILDEEYKTK